MGYTLWVLIFIFLFSIECINALYAPPVLRLPLYRNFYTSVLVGNDGQEKRLRIRIDEDKIVIYGMPSGGSYDQVSGMSYVSLGPLVANLTLPLYYTYQGDHRVSDPVQTNQRISYSGVLGLGPGSPLWTLYQYDSWRIERDFLVLGDSAPSDSLRLPSFVTVDPRNDFSIITDNPTYLRWLSTLPAYRNSKSNNNESAEEAAEMLRLAGMQPSAVSAEELASALKIYSRTSRSGGEWFSRANYATVDSAMVLSALGSDHRIEIDAYTVDSNSGYNVEMVRFEPPRTYSNFSSLARKRQLLPLSKGYILTLGMLHASDYTIFATADLTTVLLSPSPSGPFRPPPTTYIWLFLSCYLLAFILNPGIAERFQRARRLFMPTQPNEYLRELAKVHEDWTFLLLRCKFTLFASFWVMHMSLTTYRTLQSFGHRGWYIAYYVPVGYMLAHVVFGTVRYLDRHSVARYAIALQLSGVLLLMNGYEGTLRSLVMVVLSFNALRIACDRFLNSIIRPDQELNQYQRLRVLLLALAETLWLSWFSCFYVLDHIIYQVQRHVGVLLIIELSVLILFLSLCSICVCFAEESVRQRANIIHEAVLTNEQLTAQLSARRVAMSQLQDRKPAQIPQANASKAEVMVPENFHFGMNLRPIDAAVAIQVGQVS